MTVYGNSEDAFSPRVPAGTKGTRMNSLATGIEAEASALHQQGGLPWTPAFPLVFMHIKGFWMRARVGGGSGCKELHRKGPGSAPYFNHEVDRNRVQFLQQHWCTAPWGPSLPGASSPLALPETLPCLVHCYPLWRFCGLIDLGGFRVP